jgi:hypothetical protein
MLSAAGAFLVAGELLRRDISVALTHGDAADGDIIARYESAIASIAVRTTTRDEKWIIGRHLPPPDESIWIFVYLPRDRSQSADFFVLTSKELHVALKPSLEAEAEKRKAPRIWMPGLKPRDYTIARDEVGSHSAAWHKVTSMLGLPRADWSVALPPQDASKFEV